MELSVNFTPVIVNKPESVSEFLFRYFGFSIQHVMGTSSSSKGILIGSPNTVSYLLLNKHKNTRKDLPRTLTIYTSDCLKDFHTLLNLGVKVISKPDYTDQGLTMSFTDSSGNKFILLEKRNYLEN